MCRLFTPLHVVSGVLKSVLSVCLCVCVCVRMCVGMWRIIAQKPLAWLIWYLAQSFVAMPRWCTSIFYFEKIQDGRFTTFFRLKNYVTHSSSKTVSMIDLKFGKKFNGLCLLMQVWFLFWKKSKWSLYSPFLHLKSQCISSLSWVIGQPLLWSLQIWTVNSYP